MYTKDKESEERGTSKRSSKPNSRGNKTNSGKGKYGKGRSTTNSKKDYDNRSDKQKDIESDKSGTKPYNKLAYYIPDTALVDNATQLSYQTINGVTTLDDYKVPTIMRIFMNPSPGLTYQGATSAINHPLKSGINMAGLKLFNLESMYSGRNMAYAPQDVSTTILAMSQILAMHSYVHRLFQSVNVWSNYNRMFPKWIVESMGIDYDDFVSNYSDYRTRYNALVAAANQLPILINMGYLRKSLTQYSFMFTDDDSPLSQVYLYVPETTWIIDESSYQGGTILRTTQVVKRTGTRTFSDLMINVLRPMIDALLNSSTLNLVYADLMHLALQTGDVKFIQLDYVVDGETTIPFKNDEALVHIHNCVNVGLPNFPSIQTIGGVMVTPNNDVYPDPNTNSLIYNPGRLKGNVTTDKVCSTVLFDSPVSNPSPELRLEISRYVSVHTNNAVTYNNNVYLTYTIVSDYYVSHIDIIQFDTSSPIAYGQLILNNTVSANDFGKLCAYSMFDWHPIIRYYDPTTGRISYINGDLNYWTTVSVQYLERINELVYLGLFELSNKE